MHGTWVPGSEPVQNPVPKCISAGSDHPASCAGAGRGLSAAVQAERYLWSVTPCLMAWPAVMLQPGPGSLIVGTTLGVVYAVDRHFAAKALLPAWYCNNHISHSLDVVL